VWSDVSGWLMMQLRTSEGVQEGRGHVTGLIEGPGFRKDSPSVGCFWRHNDNSDEI